jgi:hypothetical protein
LWLIIPEMQSFQHRFGSFRTSTLSRDPQDELPDGGFQMRDDTQAGIEKPVKFGSLSAVLTVIVALGITFIGVREFFYPGVAAAGFGVPLLDGRDGDLLGIKGARDVTSGILVLAFLARGQRRILAYAMGILTLIPILDGLIVLKHAGWIFIPFILIHWGTAVFMLAIVELLRRGK